MLRARLDDSWRIAVWHPDKNAVEDFPAMAAEADAIIGGAIPVSPWPETPKLKLFQIPWTGHEWTSPERMPGGVPVCNCYEHETSIRRLRAGAWRGAGHDRGDHRLRPYRA
jgi:hypothetical protein